MNKFISGILTGAALATGGLAVGLIWNRLGNPGGANPNVQDNLPQPVPTFSGWPWSPFDYDK